MTNLPLAPIGVSVTAKPITAEPYDYMGETTHRLNMGAVTIHITKETARQWVGVLNTITAEETN